MRDFEITLYTKKTIPTLSQRIDAIRNFNVGFWKSLKVLFGKDISRNAETFISGDIDIFLGSIWWVVKSKESEFLPHFLNTIFHELLHQFKPDLKEKHIIHACSCIRSHTNQFKNQKLKYTSLRGK